MTKLEKEMADAIAGSDTIGDMSKAAAEVAKKYMEKAYTDGYADGQRPNKGKTVLFRQSGHPYTWLKENGITE